MSPCGHSNCSFSEPSSVPHSVPPHHGVSAEAVVAISFGVVMFVLAVCGLWQGQRRRSHKGKVQHCVPALRLHMASKMWIQTSIPRVASAPNHAWKGIAVLADAASSFHYGPRRLQSSTLDRPSHHVWWEERCTRRTRSSADCQRNYIFQR